MSSPAPVGMFLIFNAAITEPPHLLSGWPLISESAVGTAPAAKRVVGPADFVRRGRNWNRPQA